MTSGEQRRRWLRGLMAIIAGFLATGSVEAATYAEQVARLEREVAKAPPADGAWLELSALLEAEDPRRAWACAEKARATGKTPAEQLRADLWVDYLLWRQGKHGEAMAKARESAERARQLHDDDLLARALLVIASAQDRMAEFPAAFETYRELLPLADRSSDLGFRSQVYDMLGVTRFKINDLAEAEKSFDLARKFAEQSGNSLLVPPVLSHIGNVVRERGDPDRGRAMIEESVAMRVRNGGDARGIADQEINLGAIAEDASDWATALRHYERAVALHEKMGFDLNRANAEQCLAGVLTRLGRTDEAQAHLETALKLVEPTGSQTILARVYRELARLNETRGDYRAALDYARKQAAADDAALGEKSRFRLDELAARFDAERRQHEIQRLDQERRLQAAELVRVRWQRFGLFAGAAALAAMLGVLAWRFRSERRLRLQTETARRAAEEADRLKTKLLGIASHDLKSPLSSISHGAELIASEREIAPEVASMAGLIRDTARRTFALVRDLIDVAALESGGLRLQIASVSVPLLVSDSLAEHWALAVAKNQALEWVDKGPEIFVPADAARLRQALDNLLSNALKFTPAGKRVRVNVTARDGECCIEVMDEGPGLQPEDLANLFQPFRPLSARPTGDEGSSGVGLHLTHEIVTLHGGRVEAESPPGGGAVFRIFLPTVTAPAQVTQTA